MNNLVFNNIDRKRLPRIATAFSRHLNSNYGSVCDRKAGTETDTLRIGCGGRNAAQI